MKTWLIGAAVLLVLLAAAGIGVYMWAMRNQSVATLDWIDARFPRQVDIGPPVRAQYGTNPRQKLLVYRPVGTDNPELVVFIHGGGWQSGDPADYTFVARRFAQAGYATALVGYRLGPDGRFPAMLDDGAAAIRWLVDNAGELGVRTDRLVLIGHSAGAYNALMLGLDRQWLGREGLPEGTVKGVASLAGPADFYPFDTESSRLAFGRVPDPERTQPINFVRGDAPRILLIHGSDDVTVRPRNSRVLAEKLEALGAPVRLKLVPGIGHADIIMQLARPFDRDARTSDALMAFLGDVAAGSGTHSPSSGDIQPAKR